MSSLPSLNRTTKQFLWVSAYAIAMALLEAIVVIYLRGLIQFRGRQVDLHQYLSMEIGREVATLVMLVAVGYLAAAHAQKHHGWQRLAYGLFAFGLWDIWYYIWLKVYINLPEHLLSWDILFLIPFRWWGPVLSPVLIAALICISAVLLILRIERGQRPGFNLASLGLVTSGALLALYVFMNDSLHAWLSGQSNWDTLRPEPFNWPLFLVAFLLMAVPGLKATWPGRPNYVVEGVQ
jgi:hypothetical protein